MLPCGVVESWLLEHGVSAVILARVPKPPTILDHETVKSWFKAGAAVDKNLCRQLEFAILRKGAGADIGSEDQLMSEMKVGVLCRAPPATLNSNNSQPSFKAINCTSSLSCPKLAEFFQIDESEPMDADPVNHADDATPPTYESGTLESKSVCMLFSLQFLF
jgi:hypothetical protein